MNVIVSSEETYFRDKISDDYLDDLKLSLNDIHLCSKSFSPSKPQARYEKLCKDSMKKKGKVNPCVFSKLTLINTVKDVMRLSLSD
jgi:hypothetical protein